MRFFLLFLCLFFVCSCMKKPQYIPPVAVVEEEAVLPKSAAEQVEVVEPEPVTKPFAEDSLTSVITKEGIPFENIVPRSKEQISIYKKAEHYTFYYFKKNMLVLQKNYPLAEIDRLKAAGTYRETILKDLGAL